MKSRYLLLIALLIFIIVGTVLVFTGFGQHPVPQGQNPGPASSLAALSVLSGQGGDSGEVEERIARSADYQNPVVKNFVATHTRTSGSAPTVAQVSDLWEAISANWTFIRGPETSMYTPASVSISDGMKGNCLDFSILNAAVIKSPGGTSGRDRV